MIILLQPLQQMEIGAPREKRNGGFEDVKKEITQSREEFEGGMEKKK